LKLVAEVRNVPPAWRPQDWDVYLDTSPNPLALTLREAIDAALDDTEAAELADVIRPQIEGGIGTTRSAHAYLSARKPA
jgi:hypothetical protein